MYCFSSGSVITLSGFLVSCVSSKDTCWRQGTGFHRIFVAKMEISSMMCTNYCILGIELFFLIKAFMWLRG